MADWYVSSAAYALIAQFAASHAYSVGDIIRPLTTPAFTANYVFRCTTPGTSSTEPTWVTAANNNATVTTGGATFTNVTGQSAYGWSAAAGNLFCMGNNGSGSSRFSAGDRVYLSSDHTETATSASTYQLTGTAAFGSIEVLCVNRSGSVPPVASDLSTGAIIQGTTSSIAIDPVCNLYWQGITFEAGNGGSSSVNLLLANGSVKQNYFKNCLLWLNNTAVNSRISVASPTRSILDNTPLRFGSTSQGVANSFGNPLDLVWINTPSAINPAGSIPTNLFLSAGTSSCIYTLRGIDLSVLNTGLYSCGNVDAWAKILLDSCTLNSSLTPYTLPSVPNAEDEVEFVNCYNGTTIFSERHTPAGDVTTEFSITLNGGAQDNVGAFSHKMVSSSRADKFVMTLDSFWMDCNYASPLGVSKTATVEIISSGTLNVDDIALYLEYEGTSGSSVASFANSFLATPLTTTSAITTSTATWNASPSTPVKQKLQVTFTPQKAGRVRGQVRLGKASSTVYVNPQITIT